MTKEFTQMKLVSIKTSSFDLEKTLNSGQVFHWERDGNGFYGTIAEVPIYAQQCEKTLMVGSGELGGLKPSSFGPTKGEELEKIRKIVAWYFALDHPLAKICAAFPNDEAMNSARDFCRGLRIIRQPKWECLATFICSSMKQVAHIRQISRKLRERFGDVHQIEDRILYSFPTAERLATSSKKELRECALGYRATNLLATARLVAKGDVELEKMAALPDVDLRAKLCDLPGVGAKVANCVMLFAYERLRAFPIDVWIERVLREQYFARKRKVTSKQLREFAAEYFGEHGGYAQQYLFHHARMAKRGDVALQRSEPEWRLRTAQRAVHTKKCRATRRSSLHDKASRLT